MTSLLIKTFIKNYENTSDSAVRTDYGKFSSWIGIFCNAILFLFKLIIGLLSGSLSVTADAVNNLSDASSSIISLIGFKLASKPADREHPYGHGRYEYLSGLMVALLVMAIGIELLTSSIDRIIHPSAVEFSWVIVIILLFSIGLKLWMASFNYHIGKKIDSNTLIASASDSRNDVITTAAVLTASVISHFTDMTLDGYMGVCVALFILYSGFGLIKDTLDPLLGKTPDHKLVEQIHKKIVSYPGVLGTHDLMIHDYGPGRQFGSVHVEMPAEQNVLISHDTIDNIERDFLQNDNLHMIVHYDPIVTKDSQIHTLREWLSELVTQIHPDLTIHDLRIVAGKSHTNLIFDCMVPHTVTLTADETKKEIIRLVQKEHPNYYCIITIDSSYIEISP